jgi:hypothetical protein
VTVLLAIGAGALGGLAHLGVVAGRAHLVTSGRVALAVALGPLGWLGPVGAVALVVQQAPEAAWAVLPGLIIARLAVVGRVAWTP